MESMKVIKLIDKDGKRFTAFSGGKCAPREDAYGIFDIKENLVELGNLGRNTLEEFLSPRFSFDGYLDGEVFESICF